MCCEFGRWACPTVTLDYPEQLNAFPLANALSDPKQADQREERWGRLATWLRGTDADVAVVSAEQFFRVDPAVLLATLDEFLPEQVQGLRVIAYVRPHVARLISAYMQRSKAGLFHGDIETFFQRTQRENLLQFAPRFQRWREVFGDRFTLRPMIREQLRDRDVVSDFLDFALNGAPFTRDKVIEANTSLPLEFVAGLTEVQSVLKRNGVQVGTRHAVGDYVGRALLAGERGQGTRLGISQALYRDVRAWCEADAAALDRDFFGKPCMSEALDAAEADAVPTAQDPTPDAHFTDEKIKALRQLALNLVDLFKKRPLAWTVAFECEIGQRLPGPGETPPALRAHVEMVNKLLNAIAGQIGAAHGMSKQPGRPTALPVAQKREGP